MKIGIIIGYILAIILIIVSLIGLLFSKKQNESSKWALWVMLAGVIALLTAGVNTLKMFFGNI